MSDYENGNGGSFGWFLAGLGIGALVGVLYAPKSGRDTRDDLVAGALDAREKAAELYQQGAEAAQQYAQQGKEVVNDYVDKGREYYEKGRTQWSEYVDKGKQIVQDQANRVQNSVEAAKDAYTQNTSEPV